MDKDHKIESTPQDVQRKTKQEDSQNVQISEHSEREDHQEQSQELESLVISRNPEKSSSTDNPVQSRMDIPNTDMGQGFVTQTTYVAQKPDFTSTLKQNEEAKEGLLNISPTEIPAKISSYYQRKDLYKAINGCKIIL